MNRRSKIALAALLAAAAPLAGPSVARATVTHPQEIVRRPRTLPFGQLELHGGVDLSRYTYFDGATTRSETSLFAPLGIGYGITDQFEVRLFYGIALDPTFTGRTFVDVRMSYTFYRDERLAAAAQVRSGVGLGDETERPLWLGINALYRITDRFAVFTPGEQLTIGLPGEGARPITLDLPVGVGLQFTPQVFGSVTTNLARIGLANSDDAVIFGDMLPVNLAAFYSFSNRLDLGARFDIDLKNSDFFTFGVLARAFF